LLHHVSQSEELRLERPEHLPEDLRNGPRRRKPSAELRPLADVEREHIDRVLELCGGNQVEAARVLQVSRSTLWRKVRTPKA
jgi:DNA-binding NtrC family response regulator